MKYIVDNLANQTISGDLRLDGNLRVTDGTYSLLTYRALLTQTATQSGTNLTDFQSALIIGETYTITNYVAGDDFSNIANVQSGLINETGCQFIATGEFPTIWSNGSELLSSGNLAVHVLQNDLGFDISWGIGFGPGLYFGINDTTGPIYNSFPRHDTMITCQHSAQSFFAPTDIRMYGAVGSIGSTDDVIGILTYDYSLTQSVADYLYYTPVEIKMKKSLDTTPIICNGTIESSFPFGYVTVNVYSDSNLIESFSSGDTTSVSNISELLANLNSDLTTNYLGVYSDNGIGGLSLAIPTNIKNQFAPNGTFSFQVFAD